MDNGLFTLDLSTISTTRLSALTSNGFVKVSGGNGTLSVDGNTYLTTASAASTYLTQANAATTYPNVTLAGTPTYITIAGQVITRGLITLTTDVTGLLPYANLVNATAASVLVGRGAGSGAGVLQEITLGASLSMSSQVLNTIQAITTSASPTFAGLNIGTTGQDTKAKFLGRLGSTNGSVVGVGFVGIGADAQPGTGLYVDTGVCNFSAAGEEVFAVNFVATNNPASAAGAATNLFAIVAGASWQGSANSGATGLLSGAQLNAFVKGTASVLRAVASENAVTVLNTAGTTGNAYATWSHIDNVSTGLITTAQAVRATITGAGITNATGIAVDSIAGANCYGLKVEDMTLGTTSNYAIYTGAGLVRFGGAMSAPSATIPTLFGIVNFGDGSTSTASVVVMGKSGQSEVLFQCKLNNVTKVTVDNSGFARFISTVSFNGGINCYASDGTTLQVDVDSSGNFHNYAGSVGVNQAGWLFWINRSIMQSPSDGAVTVQNSARNAYSTFQAIHKMHANAVTGLVAATVNALVNSTIQVQDATGTYYTVPCYPT